MPLLIKLDVLGMAQGEPVVISIGSWPGLWDCIRHFRHSCMRHCYGPVLHAPMQRLPLKGYGVVPGNIAEYL